jgi:hypothetical protein
MTVFLSLLNSRLGIAGIGFVLLLCGFGWHKIQTGYLQHRVTVLESEKIDEQTRRRTCEFNLSDVRTALDRQNGQVEEARREADQRVAEAETRAISQLTPPEEINRMVSGPPGYEEMNLFMAGLFGRW